MSLTAWSIDAPLGYVAVAYVVAMGVLYLLGGRGRGTPLPREPLRVASFYAGLLFIVLALDSPIDHYADELFWVHMVQHVLLLTAAPPLILLGRPWPRMWRALPLHARTRLGRQLAGARWTAPIRAVARPLPAWLLFNATLVGWHVSAAYNATLSSNLIHQCEHAMFFFTGLLFWARVIHPGPLRPRLVWPMRVAYAGGAMVVGWVLAIVIVFAPHPLYAHYAELVSRPGGISALADQQLAGGMMWVPGSIAYTITVIAGFYRWLESDGTAQKHHSPVTIS
jgi:cytochrome c oxidase assembly factor CtaG